MQEFDQALRELKDAIRDGVRDHSLAAALRRKTEEIRLQPKLVEPYCDGLFRLYDLSNSPSLIKRLPNPQKKEFIVLDPLSIVLKSIVLKMLASLVAFFNDNPALDLPHSLLYEALEIMVMVSRVLLDLNHSTEVRPIYSLVVTFREAVGPVLSGDSQLAHLLNILELYELDVDSRKIDIIEYKKTLESLQLLCRTHSVPEGYLQLAYNLTLEVILKLLKKGSTQEARTLVGYLPEKMNKLVSDLMTVDPKLSCEDNGGLRVSPFYELYLQIKQSGIENIADQNLRLFIAQEEHFNDPRLFDVVALTGYMLPLEIWFEIHLNYRAKNQQIHSAYKCFLYIVDRGLQQIQSGSSSSLRQQSAEKGQVLSSLLRLAKVVIISLLAQKKDSIDPIINLIKRLCKLLIHLVMNLYPNFDEIQQYAEKLLLLCSKYNLNDVARSITCVIFYYELIMGIATEESYSQFYKANLLDKGSELFKVLKLAYQYRTGKESDVQEHQSILKKQPFILLLFANDPQQQLILRLPPQDFAKIKQKWQAYVLLLHNEASRNQPKLSKLLTHLEETIIFSQLGGMSQLDLAYTQDLVSILMDLLKQDSLVLGSTLKGQIALVLFYLITLQAIPDKLGLVNGAILLNRYSKLQKLLSLAKQQIPLMAQPQRVKYIELALYIAKTFMCNQLQIMKIRYLQGEVSAEAGLLVLVDLLNDIVQKHDQVPQSCDFFKFVRFELLCLCDSATDSEITYESNAKLLKLYCSSKYIKKQMKLKIMRKLIREALISDSKLLSLEDLGELIVIADDPKEKKIFASYIIRSFGEEGKAFMMLQCGIDPKGFGFLLQEGLDDD